MFLVNSIKADKATALLSLLMLSLDMDCCRELLRTAAGVEELDPLMLLWGLLPRLCFPRPTVRQVKDVVSAGGLL